MQCELFPASQGGQLALVPAEPYSNFPREQNSSIANFTPAPLPPPSGGHLRDEKICERLVASSRFCRSFSLIYAGSPVADAPKPPLWRRRVEPAPANHFDSKLNANIVTASPDGKENVEMIVSSYSRLGTQHRADPVSIWRLRPA